MRTVSMPQGVSFPEAACVYWAVPAVRGVHRMERRLCHDAAVLGQSPLGLMAALMLKGIARRVIAVDLIEARQQTAKALGATDVWNSTDPRPHGLPQPQAALVAGGQWNRNRVNFTSVPTLKHSGVSLMSSTGFNQRFWRERGLTSAAAAAATCLSLALAAAEPPTVTPGTESTPERPGKPPSDAIVLFDGTDLSKWAYATNKPAWKVENGYMEITPRSSGLRTKDSFGSGQYHVEWATPTPPRGTGQGRGNSGVFPMTFYEVQVLDSYRNETYADGQAGAIYGQEPPMVNSCRKPGEFQTYDLIFRRPHFGKDGKLTKPAFLTVFQNGVVVHDDTVLFGRMSNKTRKHYQPHPDRLPFALQNHKNPIRYRNIWVRPLADDTDPHDTAAAFERWQKELAEWPWKVNDKSRPRPPVITPGIAGSPPSDATVLFAGDNAAAWSGAVAVADGTLKVTGNARTREAFGDCQLHLEWRSTTARGMSRSAELVLQGRYAVKLGGAVGARAPLVIALREIGQWQSLDIVFRRPTAEAAGHVTVLLNGVLCQEAAPLPPAGELVKKAPLELRVPNPDLQLRNLWIRTLPAPGSW